MLNNKKSQIINRKSKILKQESPPRRNDPDTTKRKGIYSPEPDMSPTYYDERIVGSNKSQINGSSPKQSRQYDVSVSNLAIF